MKHFVKVTAKKGTRHFPIEVNSLDLFVFENLTCDDLDDFASFIGVKHPELLKTIIEYSINDGSSKKETFETVNGDIGNFTYELFSCADAYAAYKDCGVWFVDYVNEGEIVWTETYETLKELKTVYSDCAKLGLLELTK